MCNMPNKTRTWGFRFVATDAVTIGVVVAAALLLWRMENPLWWLLTIVAGHFFLFCNVFRLRRKLEFVWAALFLMNLSFWLYFGRLDWWRVLSAQLPISLFVIVLELRSQWYHGVFAERMNPQLADYLEGKIL